MLRLFVATLLCFSVLKCFATSEEALVRCPRREICAPCKYGLWGNDENGCPSCRCNKSPCEDYKCEDGEVCVAKGCIQGMEGCSVTMCIKKLEPKVDPSKCLMSPMCGNACEEYAIDENGCDTCKCKEAIDVDPRVQGDSRSDDESDTVNSDLEKNSQENDAKSPVCPDVKCLADTCEFGFANDPSTNCSTCNCACEAEQPCEQGMQCSSRHTCETCAAEPVCQVHSLCQNQRLHNKFIECTPSGQFVSKRCNQGVCWCVNEAGEIVQDSKQLDNNNTQCEYMRSVKAMIDFKLVHQIKDVEIHIPGLNLVVHEHISQWMSIERDLVHVSIVKDNQEVSSKNLLLVKVTVLSNERSIDLPSAVFNLRHLMNHHHCHVHYNPAPGSHLGRGNGEEHEGQKRVGQEGHDRITHTLRVENGDDSLHVKHHYKSYDNADNIRHFFEFHSVHKRPHFIMTSLMFFATVMMLTSLWALCMLCKKKAAMKKSLPLWRKTLLSDFSSNPYTKFNDNDEIIVSPGNGKEKMPIQGPVVQVAPPMTDSMIVA